MNVSPTNTRCWLGLWIASAVFGCDAVNHPVGEARQESVDATTGGAGAEGTATSDKELWSDEIVRECAGGVPAPYEQGCGFEATYPYELPYSVVFVLDHSVRMAEPIGGSDGTRWDAVREGLRNLYRDYPSPEGSSVSVIYAGTAEEPTSPELCTVSDYPVLMLPADGTGSRLDAELGSRWPTHTKRPLGAALNSAVEHFEQRSANPDEAIVIITAGAPSGCSDDPVSDLEGQADTLLNGIVGHAVPTTVIELDSDVPFDSVAEAGGTRRAVSITGGDVAAQVEQAVRNALDDLRFGQYCTFEIPGVDDHVTATRLVINEEEQEQVPRLDGPEACDSSPEGGWYKLESTAYTFQFCPCTCARALRSSGFHAVTLQCSE